MKKQVRNTKVRRLKPLKPPKVYRQLELFDEDDDGMDDVLCAGGNDDKSANN